MLLLPACATQSESVVSQRQSGWHQGTHNAHGAPVLREITGTRGAPQFTSTLLGAHGGSSHDKAGVAAPWNVLDLPRGARRKAQEDGAASRADGKWAAACLDLQAVPAGMPPSPKFDYCSCARGQLKNYSSPQEEERFRLSLNNGRGRGRPKLLVLGGETEQLTKGRMHMAEAMLLASKMKRTLVLPGSQDSTLGFFGAMPMCAYFDTERVGQFVNWVAKPVLVEWMKQHELSVVPLFLVWEERPCNESITSQVPVSLEAAWTPLYRAMLASVRRGDAVCLVDSGPEAFASLEKQLRDPKHSVLHQADVVVVMKNAFHELFPSHHMQKPLEHLQYSPHLHAIATAMAQGHLLAPALPAPPQTSQGPPRYVAVQWRMEQTMGYIWKTGGSMEEGLKLCAQGIVASAQESLRALGPGTVLFLASDVDMDVSNDASSKLGQDFTSTSFGKSESIKESAANAMKIVHELLQPVTWRHVEPLFPLVDGGLQGNIGQTCLHECNSFSICSASLW